jgi:2-octaprenyl-6-methoxyphenol hydroxylase
MKLDYDILIIGGGMVGASLVRAIHGLGLRIGLVEAWPYDSQAQPSYDDRVLALSWGTRLILQGIGLWHSLQPAAQPIKHIHISDRGHFGFTRLNSREEGVEALGYVITARALGQVLLQGLDQLPAVELLCPASLHSLLMREDRVEVSLDMPAGRKTLTTRLLVAADGGDSEVRRLLSIATRERSYGQTAIIANITPERPHRGVAYERFTDTGPLAVLPMIEGHCSLVWTTREAQAPELMDMGDRAFLERLQERFGYRLGRLRRVGRRIAYPLRLRQAKQQVRPRVALIGNASHTIHPVAGQGFNLGIRDVAVLADILNGVARSTGDPGSLEHLQAYAEWRQQDQNRVVTITDTLARLFANPLPPLRMARNLGLVGLDLTPPLKHLVARQFMGLQGRQPRLARGFPLA